MIVKAFKINRINLQLHSRIKLSWQLPWQYLWFVGLLLIVGVFYQKNLERIVGNTIFLLADRSQQQHNIGAVRWWSEFAYQTGLGQAANYDQAGVTYARLGQIDEQMRWSLRAINAEQPTATTLNNFVVTGFLQGNSAEIQSLMAKAFTLAPNNAALRYNLGMVYLRQGDFASAKRLLKEATYINEKWSLPYLQLGAANLANKDYKQAEAMAKMAVQLDPSQLAAHLALIHALYAQPDQIAALIDATENALTYFPNNATLLLYYALFLRDHGEHEQALTIMRNLYPITYDPIMHDRLAKEIQRLLFAGN